MSRMRMCDNAKDNKTVEGFCVIKTVQVRANVKGSSYLDMVLFDAGGESVAKLWDYNIAQHGVFEADQVIKIRGSLVQWKDAEQIKIERIRATTDEDPIDFDKLVPCAPFDTEMMYETLYETAGAFEDDDLRRLTQYLLRENKEKLLLYPAAVKLHHATRGGLLHHLTSVLALARAVCAVYPAVDTDLLYAGVILHDIAKLEELDTGKLGLAGSYTVRGQLLGHINMGVSLIRSTCELLGVPEEVSMLVEHMLLAHHGVPEFGSPKPPMFPEAEILAELDMLDSRIYEMFDALEGVPVGGFSERIWALDNRQLYQHGHQFLKKTKEE